MPQLDLATVIKELKDFYPDISERIVIQQRKKFERILRDFDEAIAVYITKFEITDPKACLKAIRDIKNFTSKDLKDAAIKFYKEIFTIDEISILFNVNFDYVQNHYRMQETREEKAAAKEMEKKAKAAGISLFIPPNLRDKDISEMTFEETAEIARIIMMTKVIEDRDVDAAMKLITMQHQNARSDSIKKFKQVKIMDEFYMTRFLPALQKELANAGINVDVKMIVRKLLQEVSTEMREQVKMAITDNQELDDLVAKAKRRGKHFKEEEGAE